MRLCLSRRDSKHLSIELLPHQLRASTPQASETVRLLSMPSALGSRPFEKRDWSSRTNLRLVILRGPNFHDIYGHTFFHTGQVHSPSRFFQAMNPQSAAQAATGLLNVGRVVLFGGAAVYGLSNSLFNVEGGHRAIVFNRVFGIKETVRGGPHAIRSRSPLAP